jgi:hypothetical protein
MSNRGEDVGGSDRMYAAELNDFEHWCPEFDSLSDDLTEDFGPNRVGAIRKWIAQRRRSEVSDDL